MDHVSTRITKRMVEQATPSSRRYIIWDRELKGFGIRIESTGTKCYLVRYRPKGIAGAPKRFITIGRHGPVTAEQARTRALSILGSVASGHDPAGSERAGKDTPGQAQPRLADVRTVRIWSPVRIYRVVTRSPARGRGRGAFALCDPKVRSANGQSSNASVSHGCATSASLCLCGEGNSRRSGRASRSCPRSRAVEKRGTFKTAVERKRFGGRRSPG